MKNKKTKDIIIVLIMILAIAGIVIPRELNDLDEMWNYNFARNIADGLLPYKDFNMVQTPLLPIICGIILKLTFNELIVMRILSVILMTAILFITYKIFELLKINKYIINIFTIALYFMFYKYFCIDYNFSILLITLIVIYMELKNLQKQDILQVNRKDFWLGILVGASILFKQTTGLFLSIIFVFYKLLIVSNKEEFKKSIKIIFTRFLGIVVPVILFVIYLTINNIWYEFLDYTVYSLSTFTNKISYVNLIKGVYGLSFAILSILVPIIIILMYFISVCKKIKTNEQKNIFVLFAYSVAAFIVVYPISDGIHFLIGCLPCLIALGYIIWLIIKKLIHNKKQIKVIEDFCKCYGFILTLLILNYSILILLNYAINCNKYVSLAHFKYIESNPEFIEKIDNFILEQSKQDKTVYILDSSAVIYMIPLNKYNKDYDMFLKGNLGAKGEAGQIEKLKQANKTIVLIINESQKRNWQNPEEVREYIIKNWTKIGEIENFDIYEK